MSLIITALLPLLALGLRQRDWRPSDNLAPLCIEGKLVPELYLIGVQKAATTTLGAKLICAGVASACRPGLCMDRERFIGSLELVPGKKECHLLDGSAMFWGQQFREWWLRSMPYCPAWAAGTHRSILGDYTPAYLRLIPMPTGAHDLVPSFVHNADWRLSSLYGGDAHRLRFVVLLREPLSRMHSAYHGRVCCRECHMHTMPEGKMSSLTKTDDEGQQVQESRELLCGAASFQDAMVQTLRSARANPPVIEDWLWASLYGQQMKTWLRRFKAEQFYVIPFKYSTAQSLPLCWELRKFLEFDLDCSVFEQVIHTNHAHTHLSHRSLEEDISPEVREDFYAYVREERKTLLHLLSNRSSVNLGLYKGGPVEEWLEAGW